MTEDDLKYISAALEALATIASRINAARDGLGAAILMLETHLKTLNLGVAAWHQVGRYAIGYSKINNKWSIALRDHGNPSGPKETWQIWAYNEAPTYLRVDAVAWLPNLFETLIKRAEEAVVLTERATSVIETLLEAEQRKQKPTGLKNSISSHSGIGNGGI